MKITFLTVIVTFKIVLTGSVAISDPIVSTENGEIRGRKSADGSYSYFLGIPYSKVDPENPFGPGTPLAPFKGIYDANNGSVKCPQAYLKVKIIGNITHQNQDDESLDCLRLNVFVPNESSRDNRLPVLVFIHGGAFSVGSAGEDGVPNVVRHGIVVVTINYRLGPYGFFCLNTPRAPGNQGIKDQYEALLWVKKNIASFGGNPHDVTLGGVSAGACSALLHLFASKEKVFNKVIAESGAPQVEGMFEAGKKDAALLIANNLGLKANDTDEALTYLSQTPFQDVMKGMVDSDFRLMPCKEERFDGIDNYIYRDPFSLSNDENTHNIPILIGHANKELSLEFGRYNNVEIYYNTIKNMFKLNDSDLNKIVDIVKDFYSGKENSDLCRKSEDFDGDISFNHPIKRTIASLVERNVGTVYAYVFTYVGNTNRSGAQHSAEFKYLFQNKRSHNVNGQSSSDDQLVSDRLTTMWANFIKYGNPTPEITNLLPVTWKPVDLSNWPYLEIGTDLKLKYRVFNKRMSFWDLFYLAYGNTHYLIDK